MVTMKEGTTRKDLTTAVEEPEVDVATAISMLKSEGVIRAYGLRDGLPVYYIDSYFLMNKPKKEEKQEEKFPEIPSLGKPSAVPAAKPRGQKEKVMDFLKHHGPADARTIGENTDIPVASVQTVLPLLYNKGQVDRKQDGNRKLYFIKGDPRANRVVPQFVAPAKQEEKAAEEEIKEERPPLPAKVEQVGLPEKDPLEAWDYNIDLPIPPNAIRFFIGDRGEFAIQKGDIKLPFTKNDFFRLRQFIDATELVWKESDLES